jgi:hypothetical protein
VSSLKMFNHFSGRDLGIQLKDRNQMLRWKNLKTST